MREALPVPIAETQVDQWLRAWSDGDDQAFDELVRALYGELRAIAGRYLRSERDDHTLQPTALVHEAYLRLAALPEVDWEHRSQFFYFTARLMRRLLVDHARRRNVAKRGSGSRTARLDEALDVAAHEDVALRLEIAHVGRAVERYATLSPTGARIVDLRFFGGLSIDETAALLGLSRATVIRRWRIAKVWLREELGEDGSAAR